MTIIRSLWDVDIVISFTLVYIIWAPVCIVSESHFLELKL